MSLKGAEPIRTHHRVQRGLRFQLVVPLSDHSIYNGYWCGGRPSVYDLWRDLREASAQIPPDWDLGKPGLREAWGAGDLGPFHGWGAPAEPAVAPA